MPYKTSTFIVAPSLPLLRAFAAGPRMLDHGKYKGWLLVVFATIQHQIALASNLENSVPQVLAAPATKPRTARGANTNSSVCIASRLARNTRLAATLL